MRPGFLVKASNYGILGMRTLAVAFIVLVGQFLAGSAFAAPGDFHTGTFEGSWCRYGARFDVVSRDGNSWVFRGSVLISSTGQYDHIRIEQFSDNSLRVVRYLQGTETGQVQTIQTAPPQRLSFGGVLYDEFVVTANYGLGCSLSAGSVLMRIPAL